MMKKTNIGEFLIKFLTNVEINWWALLYVYVTSSSIKRLNAVECQGTVVIEILAAGHRYSNRLGEAILWIDEP